LRHWAIHWSIAEDAGVELELVSELPRLLGELTVEDLHELLCVALL
jgi:hypothetical protein